MQNITMQKKLRKNSVKHNHAKEDQNKLCKTHNYAKEAVK